MGKKMGVAGGGGKMRLEITRTIISAAKMAALFNITQIHTHPSS